MELRIIPLGGLGEFGMNCCVMESGDDIIVVDAGLMFPDESAPGIDVVIPEMEYLFERKDRVRAVLLTHAHEDHTGALPYLLKQLPVPVYGSPLTLALIQSKLDEHAIDKNHPRIPVAPRERVTLGCFEVEFLRMAHSVPDSLGLAIATPAGMVLHSGDFKLDTTPFRGEAVDFHRVAHHGDRGVLALMSDSTNAERPGYTPSETSITAHFEQIFAKAAGTIFVTCFATSLARIQQVIDMAHAHARRVGILGRAMRENVEISHRLGYLEIPDGLLVRKEEIKSVPRHHIVVLATGSQGEPLSAIGRISMHDHPHARVEPGDNVIISARVIPGNEKSVSRVINRLVRRGARVHHEEVADVHVSGHASQEELKLLLSIVRPRFFIPVHGEFRQLYAHADLARQIGMSDDRIIVAESGDIVEFTGEGARIAGKVEVGRVFIDVGGYGEVEESVLHDRKHLSADGFVVIVLAINKGSCVVQGAPEIITRGFLEFDGDGSLQEAQEKCLTMFSEAPPEERQDWATIKEKLRREMRRFFYKRTMKRPMIIPVIMEV